MKPSDKIFRLVKALTKTEKRYVTLYIARNEPGKKEKVSLQLFEELNRMAVYSDEHLKQKFPDMRLSVEKVRLRNLILRALREYHAEKSVDSKLCTFLENVEILVQKGLYDIADEQIQKAVTLSEKYERHWMALRFLSIRRGYIQAYTRSDIAGEVEKNIAQTNTVLEAIANEVAIRDCYDRVFVIARGEFTAPGKDRLERIEELIAHLGIYSEADARTHLGKMTFNAIQDIRYQLRGEFEKTYEHRRRIVELHEEARKLRPDEHSENSYIIALANYATICIRLKKYSDYHDAIQRLNNVQPDSFDEQAEQFQNVVFLESLYCLNTALFDEESVRRDEAAFRKGELLYGAKMNAARKIVIRYHLGLMHFFLQQCRQAQDFFTSIAFADADKRSEHRRDIKHSSLILLLLVYFECLSPNEKDRIFFEHMCTDVRLRLKKEGVLREFEKKVLSFVKKLPDLQSTHDVKKSCAKFLQEIDSMIKSDPTTQRIPGITELRYWLQSKITGRKLIDILRDNIGE